jgi:hypothetical protein
MSSRKTPSTSVTEVVRSQDGGQLETSKPDTGGTPPVVDEIELADFANETNGLAAVNPEGDIF